MRNKVDNIPEVFLSSRQSSKAVSRMVQAGIARKLGPRLYTRSLKDPPEEVVRRNLWTIVALLAPGTVVSHRTAFENRQAPDGSVFLSGPYTRQLDLPGLTIRQVQSSGPVDGDTPFMGTLYLASRPRAFLENLLPSRQREKVARTVGRNHIEQRLSELMRVSGEEALIRLRDEARLLAPKLGLESELRILDGIIGALLRSRPAATLAAPAARAWAAGEPYDPMRARLFDDLFSALRNVDFADRPDEASVPPAFQNAAFYDAYFSNYIEGTTFPVDLAMRIVFQGEMLARRPADAHDVLGTYRLLASRDEMQERPTSFDELEILLKRRHAAIMEGRPENLPGQYKTESNQAGATLFVDPNLVRGTLRQGFEMYRGLSEPFARAVFMMFLIAEVHPFKDGNGRMARVMMNAELLSAGQTRIIIPSLYRNEYIGGLKRLTNGRDPDALLRVMDQSQLLVSRIDFSDLERARGQIAACNAFSDPSDDVRLRIPPEPLRPGY